LQIMAEKEIKLISKNHWVTPTSWSNRMRYDAALTQPI
jgi:hypothetical protein